MSMKKLAEEVAKDAKAEAEKIIQSAKDEAASIMEEAQSKADSIRASASAKAEKEAKQVSREVVASANQAMQKDILIAKKEALDTTLSSTREILADAGWKKRSSLLKALMAQADEMSDSSYTVHPVDVDKAAVKKLAGDRKVGDSIDGLGGFMLVSKDGSVSFDFRFDSRLDQTWSNNLAGINKTLFG